MFAPDEKEVGSGEAEGIWREEAVLRRPLPKALTVPPLWRRRRRAYGQTKDKQVRFCSLRPIGRNLIRNPCGQEGLRKWRALHGGDGWVVENNLVPVPGAPSQTCFVTSYGWCSKKQILNLEAEGLWPELLDSGKIDICVSDWWGVRHDCGGWYQLLVQLLDANKTVLDEFSATRSSIAHPKSMYFQVTHVFSNIKVGVRFVSFEHAGKDTLFWAGHYGTRMTNSSVTVRVSQP
ncbi:F-box only protein 27-like [Octodon degus]|uniref:F-box only protein 27-like n=1 Tax=Octodon degus TaxID=10160 RepID=A0A6P6EY77_OCTDE|nr:F-box only protein 27-like [Octodon degus]